MYSTSDIACTLSFVIKPYSTFDYLYSQNGNIVSINGYVNIPIRGHEWAKKRKRKREKIQSSTIQTNEVLEFMS